MKELKVINCESIRFVVKVESTGLGFIEPVDVTTLFGNLLENAMQAVLKCSGERYIKVYIKNYNEMISLEKKSIPRFLCDRISGFTIQFQGT